MLEEVNSSSTHGQFQFVDDHPLGKDFRVEHYRLDNGLGLLIMEDHSAPLFSYHTWFRVGSRHEQRGRTGIAHLFEHLMFKATKSYADGHFFSTVETQGGRLNAGTSKDWTFYYQTLPTGNLDLIASLESERMQNVVLNNTQINTERQVVKEERLFRTENNIDGQMNEQLYLHAFTVHPYHWPVIGFMQDLDSISQEDCLLFYKTFYAPNNALLVIVGDVDTKAVLQTVLKYYGKIPAQDIKATDYEAEPPQQKERRHTIKSASILTDKVLIGYRIPAASHQDRIPLEVLNALLVEGKSSRLYKKLIDESKIATAVSGSIETNVDPGLLKISVALSQGHTAAEAEKIIYAEIAKIQEQPIPERELEKTKNTVEAYFVRLLKVNHYRAFSLGFFHTVFADYREMFKEVERFRDVRENQVQRVAKQYLTAAGRTVIVAKPMS